MRVLSCVFLLAAFVAAVSATAIDDEITKLETTIVMLKAEKANEEAEQTLTDAQVANKKGLTLTKAVAMASSSGSSSVEAGDTSDNSEFDIEPQATRASTEATSASASSSSSATSSATASSSSTTGSVEAAASASAASASASSSASTVAPTAFALVSAVVYAML